MVVGIVDQHDVDPVQPQPLQALLQRPPHAVAGEVPDPLGRRAVGEPLGVGGLARGQRADQPPDLGGDDEAVPRQPGQQPAEAALGQPEPVVGGRVHVGEAGLQGRADGGRGVLLGNRGEQVAERGGAEGQGADPEPAAAEGEEARGLMVSALELGPTRLPICPVGSATR